jgi:hypothetical protein
VLAAAKPKLRAKTFSERELGAKTVEPSDLGLGFFPRYNEDSALVNLGFSTQAWRRLTGFFACQ